MQFSTFSGHQIVCLQGGTGSYNQACPCRHRSIKTHNAGKHLQGQQVLPALPASVAGCASSASCGRGGAQQKVTGDPVKGSGRSMLRPGPPLVHQWRRLLLDCNANQDFAAQIASGCFSLGSAGPPPPQGASGSGQSPAPPSPGTGSFTAEDYD